MATNRLLSKIEETEFGRRVLKDKHFRFIFTSSLSMGWNLIYAIFNAVLAIVYRSYWFLTMFVYYAALGLMRMFIIRSKKDNVEKMVKASGIGIILLSIVVIGVITLSIAETRNTKYHLIVMLVIATYTFYLITNSIIGAVKAHRQNNLKIKTLRNISLVSTIGAVLSLERSMLGTFGDAKDAFTFIMEALSGAAAFILILAIGLLTIKSSKSK